MEEVGIKVEDPPPQQADAPSEDDPSGPGPGFPGPREWRICEAIGIAVVVIHPSSPISQLTGAPTPGRERARLLEEPGIEVVDAPPQQAEPHGDDDPSCWGPGEGSAGGCSSRKG